jgi:hypothetical protein
MNTTANTGVREAEQWRARVRRALDELRQDRECEFPRDGSGAREDDEHVDRHEGRSS